LVVGSYIADDADDRLAATTVGRVERCRSLFEGVYGSNEWTQPPISKPVLQRGKRCAIGFDDEEDSPSVFRLSARWLGDADKRTTRTDQRR